MFKVAFLVYAVFAGDVVYDKLKEIRHNVPLGDLLYTYKPMMISQVLSLRLEKLMTELDQLVKRTRQSMGTVTLIEDCLGTQGHSNSVVAQYTDNSTAVGQRMLER